MLDIKTIMIYVLSPNSGIEPMPSVPCLCVQSDNRFMLHLLALLP